MYREVLYSKISAGVIEYRDEPYEIKCDGLENNAIAKYYTINKGTYYLEVDANFILDKKPASFLIKSYNGDY